MLLPAPSPYSLVPAGKVHTICPLPSSRIWRKCFESTCIPTLSSPAKSIAGERTHSRRSIRVMLLVLFLPVNFDGTRRRPSLYGWFIHALHPGWFHTESARQLCPDYIGNLVVFSLLKAVEEKHHPVIPAFGIHVRLIAVVGVFIHHLETSRKVIFKHQVFEIITCHEPHLYQQFISYLQFSLIINILRYKVLVMMNVLHPGYV